MTDRPIAFSPAMMRAVLREIAAPGTGKTQTRRVLKLGARLPEFCGGRGDLDDPTCWGWQDDEHGDWITLEKDVGQRMGWRDWRGAFRVGDRLYVREAWRAQSSLDDVSPRYMSHDEPIWFEADSRLYRPASLFIKGRLRPPMFMPRWASRMTLTVTDIRVERVLDISEPDAIAEGAEKAENASNRGPHRVGFFQLWDSLNADRGLGCEVNPWVVAVTFTPAMVNIDEAAQ